MVHKSIEFSYSHRYHLSHEPTGEEKKLWMVLHGYGQLGNYFLRKFDAVNHAGCLIVAPEGINHHYLEGFSGRVGANWMTKHERETDILNVMNYLNEVITSVWDKVPQAEQLNVLGFSQGAAMMSRWLAQSPHSINQVIFWGGGMAHDLDPQLLRNKLLNSRVTLALGDQDPFISEERFKEQKGFLEKAALPDLRIVNYKGGHDLDPELLNQLFLS